MKPKTAVAIVVMLVGTCGFVSGQLPRGGGANGQAQFRERYGRNANAEAAKRSQAAARQQIELQQQAQAMALAAQQAALLRERQEIVDRIYLRYPRPIDPKDRIVDGKLYDPKTSTLWGNVADLCTGREPSQWQYAILEVESLGKTSVLCRVYENENGLPPLGGMRSSGAFLKRVLIYNHPNRSDLTTGQALRPCIAMRVENWSTNGISLEAYDCGVPDSIETRKVAGIRVPTPEQTAAAREEVATALKQLAEKKVAAQNLKKQAADEKALQWNQEQADKGDAYGLFRMGERCRDGVGVAKDLPKAMEYFRKAIAAGSTTAEAELSKLVQVPVNASATP